MRALLALALMTSASVARSAPCGSVRAERGRRGLVHGVMVDGRFWTDASRGSYTNAAKDGEAEKVCRDKAPWLRLPAKAEVEALAARLRHDWSDKACAGDFELQAAMPDGRGRHFWSSSPVDGAPDEKAWGYWGTDGSFSQSPRGGRYGVRCVSDAGAAIPAASTAAVDHAWTPVYTLGKTEPREFSSCVTSLTNDSGVGEEAASEACKSRWSREFYFCVYHLVNAGGKPERSLESCLLKPPAAPAADPGKLDRWLKSCEAGNLYGCVLVGKEKEKGGDAAGAKPFYEKACAGGFKPGCEARAGR